MDFFNPFSAQFTSQVISQFTGQPTEQPTEPSSTDAPTQSAAADTFLVTAQQTFDSALQSLRQTVEPTVENLQAQILGLGAAGGTLANSLAALPRTAEALARDMPAIARRMKMGGVRPGDCPRSAADTMALFNQIPGTSKLGDYETKIRQFLANKDASHVIPHSKGGGNRADNIRWEASAANRARGAVTMTPGEQVYIRVANAVESILQNSGAIARLGLTATGSAIVVQVVVTAIAYSLDLYRGDITVDEYKALIWEAAKQAGIATPIVFLILIAVLALVPELTVLLSAPVVVAGFNALFGISIATPIIQSLLRHLEATENNLDAPPLSAG